jgi:hypothetical protein
LNLLLCRLHSKSDDLSGTFIQLFDIFFFFFSTLLWSDQRRSMSSESVWRERLVEFYAVYNPSCVNSVDAILSTYKGREDDLLKVLVAKYGPEPSSATQASPSSVPRGVSSGVGEMAGYKRSETPLELLANHEDERKVNPVRSERPVSAQPRTTEELISTLVKKYGPEPSSYVPPKTAASPPPNGSVAAVAEQPPKQGWRQRFYNFFSYYNPDKLSELDQKLARHEGREAEWMQNLLLKYGPEPPPRKLLLPPSTVAETLTSNSHQREYHTHRDASPTPRIDERTAHQQVKTSRVSSLSSPSPPNHPVYQPVLAQRFQNPQLLSSVSAAENDGDGSGAANLSEVVTKLTGALEQKTRELLKYRGEKMELEEHLNRSAQDSKAHASQISVLNEKLLDSEQRRRDAETARDAALDQQSQLSSRMEELLNVRSEHSSMSRTLAAREHQCRSQRNEIDQVTQELILRERQLTELSVTLRELHEVNKGLIEDNSALRLALVDPGSESRFHKVVEDIQEASQSNFNHRRKVLELEMQQYYEYAKHQIEQRDVTIRSLGEQLSASFMAGAPGSHMVDEPGRHSQVPHGGGAHEHRALAEEVARLKLQIAVQAEEHKSALLASSLRRTSFELAPPPLQHGEAELFQSEIDRLRSRLRQAEDEASVAKEALQSELRRQVEEMKDIHDRVDAYEREKSHLIATIHELNSKPAPPLDTVESTRPAAAYDTNFTRSNVWSLLYER